MASMVETSCQNFLYAMFHCWCYQLLQEIDCAASSSCLTVVKVTCGLYYHVLKPSSCLLQRNLVAEEVVSVDNEMLSTKSFDIRWYSPQELSLLVSVLQFRNFKLDKMVLWRGKTLFKHFQYERFIFSWSNKIFVSELFCILMIMWNCQPWLTKKWCGNIFY